MSTNHGIPTGGDAQVTVDLSREERRLLKRSAEQIGRCRGNPLDLNVEPLEDRVAPRMFPPGWDYDPWINGTSTPG